MKRFFTCKYLLIVLVLFFSFSNLFAQISFSNTTTAITQNFNTLAQSGTSNTWADNTTIPGWYSNRTVYIGDAGTSTTGALYSYGSAASSDRALGAVTSGTTATVQFGIRLVNNTGGTLSGLTISYRGEQWRQNTGAQTLVFESQVAATSLTTGTWTPTTALNFTGSKTGTAGALDGNATGNFTAISANLTATVSNGQEIWLRWTKTLSSSSGLSIDDLSITGIAAISSDANLSNLVLSAGAITPSFSASTLSYTSSVANAVTSTTITPTSTDANSTIKVNGVTVASGTPSGTINLSAGSNVITTVVTAQDGTTTKSYTINITRAAAGTPLLTTTSALTAFGNVCINTSTAQNSFTLDGSSLDGTPITISALSGFTFSETVGGTYTSTLSFTYTGTSFTSKIIYVKFSPIAVQSYDGNIVLNGGGVSNFNVSASGSGINTTPTVTTTGSSNITANSANLQGAINGNGCSTITNYGFEYSTASGFPNGTGTPVSANNLTGGNFSFILTGLLPNTRYYFKAFATNSGGTSYGLQQAFTNTPLPVLISAEPNLTYTQTFSDVGSWGSFFTSGNGANHFGGLSATATAPASGIPSPTITTASSSNFNSNTFTSSGGIHRFIDSVTATQSIIFLSTGSPDNTTSTALDFYMDFTGLNAGTLSFDYATINNSTGNRNGSFRVYATTDGVTFTELTFASVLDFTNNVPISGTKSNIQLPASFNNSSTARLRFYYHNGSAGTGSGSRPKISIDNLTVTGVATTPCATPTAPATSLVFGAITDTTIAASFTAASPASDNYLIVMSTNSNLISNPVNGQTYNIGDNVGDGSVISKGTGTSFTATRLNAQTTYYFFVFPMNAICTGGPLYYTTNVLNGSATTIAGLPPCAVPTNQPINLTFGTSTTSSITGSFTATTADQYLVVRSTSNSLGADPVNATAYNSGDIIGNGKVVQRSSATSFSANGLLPSTTYYFFVFSLNNQACINGPAYNVTTPLSSSTTTMPLPPCTNPTSQGTALSLAVSNTSISGTFTGVSGADNYLIIKSTFPTLGAAPSDNVDYNPGDVFGSGTVLSNTTTTSFYATALTPNITYYFFIFTSNKFCSGGSKYNSTNPLTGNGTTANNGLNNYYFGTLHSHSDYSDGNADNPGYTPAQDYAFAKNSLCMDYLGISEHNHFSTVNNPGNQIDSFHRGSVQANNFTSSNPNFLAMYGMEWGVISGGGHVVIYGNGMDELWGWETGAGTWGPTNNYDVYVPKSVYTGSTGLFKTVNDNIAKNTFATLAHPNLTDYNNVAGNPYDVVADNAIVGAAVESGPAFSTNTSYSNPGSSLSYLYYYQLLLSKGYHLGPTIDHDNHNTTFGRTTTSRTAILSPVLDKTSIVGAMRKMNFYATEDCDTKVNFTINTKIMGSSLSDRFGPNISVSLSDATTSLAGAIIRVMYGTPGSGLYAVKIDSAIGSTLSFTDNNLADMATGYYYLDITNGASRIVTSPIWYTRNDGLTTLPVKLNSFTVQKASSSAQLDWSTAQETNSSYFNIEKSADGRKWTGIARVNAAGNSTTVKNYRAFDNNPFNGINYYRLKQFDADGKFEYSLVKSISFSKAYSIIVAPNPAKDFINISTTKNQSTILSIQLVDVSGKILKTVLLADNKLKLNLAGIAKGLYFIKVEDDNNVQTQKIIIE